MTEQLLKEFEEYIQEITLIPSAGGRFEVTVNDQLIFSKAATHRHAEYAEIRDKVRSLTEEG